MMPNPKIIIEQIQASALSPSSQEKKKNTSEERLNYLSSTKCRIFLCQLVSPRNQKPPLQIQFWTQLPTLLLQIVWLIESLHYEHWRKYKEEFGADYLMQDHVDKSDNAECNQEDAD